MAGILTEEYILDEKKSAMVTESLLVKNTDCISPLFTVQRGFATSLNFSK